jgi:hypothetical protein
MPSRMVLVPGPATPVLVLVPLGVEPVHPVPSLRGHGLTWRLELDWVNLLLKRHTLRVRGWYLAVPLDYSFGPSPNCSREADSPLPGPSTRKSTVFSQNRANFGPSLGSAYKRRARAAQGKPRWAVLGSGSRLRFTVDNSHRAQAPALLRHHQGGPKDDRSNTKTPFPRPPRD